MQLIEVENLPGGSAAPPIRVGDVAIAEEAIAQEMQYHPSETVGEAQLKAARALVVRELLSQRAVELGLPPVVDAQGVENDAAMTELLDRELEVPEPDETACKRFFEAHPERFYDPVQLKVRHILLAAAPDDAQTRDAQYHEGVELLEELTVVPERFTEFALRHSACPSKDEGGELGWLTAGQTVPELDRALQHLPEGLHDRPLASRYGWHLVSIDKRVEAQPLPFEAVADKVHHTLHEQATRRALRHYLLALEETYGVEGLALDEDADGALMQ
ncbi:peptidyl-prolyl cis-trans isomerase C [Modicisalibacter ilicicola DSM 19980]|uniref:peptidylprolyl isomerase n=1 Tax=Modicisalibacter ilicicola DSM 19980 TaxID=1121942 RepID=A0A1M4WDA4_9GAMM|nr:peptidylprolyl isomerase [Halomonas ilicicola]SHE79238.1 peptidyl-prolyl cis-trans isomerase C [Halomonas ilicicola DSM 19980]